MLFKIYRLDKYHIYCGEKPRWQISLDTKSSLLYNDIIITIIMAITAMINQSLTITKHVKLSQLQPCCSLWLSSLIMLLLSVHNQLEKLQFWMHRDSKAIKYQNTRGFQTQLNGHITPKKMHLVASSIIILLKGIIPQKDQRKAPLSRTCAQIRHMIL